MKEIRLNELKKVHFTGIGGINMSAIAMVLMSRGISVTGSDSRSSEITDTLQKEGAVIFIGQSADNISDDIDALVYTAAVAGDNPEIQAARGKGIPCFSRAEFLGRMMKDYDNTICVSGTHGKTTTTSMMAGALMDLGADPTIMVGGVLPSINGNVRIGRSGTFLAEACEYTNSFLSFYPDIAVILNVCADHMDFFADLDDIRHSFREFARLVPEDGALVINGEIEDLSFFTEGLDCRVVTFGVSDGLDLRAVNITYNKLACPSFDVIIGGKSVHMDLSVPGEHNLFNSLASLAALTAMGLDPEKAASSISGFKGVDRRFQYKGEVGGVTVIDDYAHHPDEIEATLKAAKNIPHRKLWVVFQPHTYSRTEVFMDRFADSLKEADEVILAPIYAAREQNIHGISSETLMQKIEEKGTSSRFFQTFDEIENFLLENCKEGDVFITMGAGDVVLIGDHILGR